MKRQNRFQFYVSSFEKLFQETCLNNWGKTVNMKLQPTGNQVTKSAYLQL